MDPLSVLFDKSRYFNDTQFPNSLGISPEIEFCEIARCSKLLFVLEHIFFGIVPERLLFDSTRYTS
ncbi:hypothetical protein HanPI659440_Chr04g0169721 [Helianthus annuus]|nr:hypothetical protein HanPI659440_Chr04g0169721 [Helianthus annuus]